MITQQQHQLPFEELLAIRDVLRAELQEEIKNGHRAFVDGIRAELRATSREIKARVKAMGQGS